MVAFCLLKKLMVIEGISVEEGLHCRVNLVTRTVTLVEKLTRTRLCILSLFNN